MSLPHRFNNRYLLRLLDRQLTPSTRSPMRIDSVLPNRASPGQSVIIQGDGLEAAEKVFFGDQEVSFEVDGETLVAEVPDGSGSVEVTVQGSGGTSEAYSVTIE
jgi:hypothetical protein